MKRHFCLLVVFFIVATSSCDHKPVRYPANALQLSANKNFLYENVTDTRAIKLEFGPSGEIYSDEAHKMPFFQFSPDQLTVLAYPVISKRLGVDSQYVHNLMNGYLLARQPKIGGLQPVIIYLGGNDYGSMFLLILGKNDKPVSCFDLYGNMLPGNYSENNDYSNFERSYSILDGFEITTYRITQFEDSKMVADSSVFKSVISKTGEISTKLLVKAKATYTGKK